MKMDENPYNELYAEGIKKYQFRHCTRLRYCPRCHGEWGFLDRFDIEETVKEMLLAGFSVMFKKEDDTLFVYVDNNCL